MPAGSTFASLFPDRKLALTVETQLYPKETYDELDTSLSVTQEELDQITFIADDPRIAEDPINSIEGVQYLRNLEILYIGSQNGFKGDTTNLEVVSGLKHLKELSIVNYSLNDISGLANLTQLTYLDLSMNNITDASPLSGLVNLEHLNLVGNPGFSTLAPFLGLMKLDYLIVSTKNISDFRPLGVLPIVHNPSSLWNIYSSVNLPDARVGDKVFMQVIDPLGGEPAYGTVFMGNDQGGVYQNHYTTWTASGDKGRVMLISEPYGDRQFVRVDFHQKVLPAC